MSDFAPGTRVRVSQSYQAEFEDQPHMADDLKLRGELGTVVDYPNCMAIPVKLDNDILGIQAATSSKYKFYLFFDEELEVVE